MDGRNPALRRRHLGWLALALFFAALVLVWMSFRRAPIPVGAATPQPSLAAGETNASPLEVELTSAAVERSNLKTGIVELRNLSTTVRVPGIVQPDAYREVMVTPVAGGIITKTFVQLGDAIRPGDALADIFSSELAEAQTHYLAESAELRAEHAKLNRTRELLQAGAASQQELESVQASHSAHTARVRAAHQKLLLLGMTKDRIRDMDQSQEVSANLIVPAPIGGIVTARMANTGQVVTTERALFTVTDLSSVWIIADLFERDFSTIQVGSYASITSPAYPGRMYGGKVSYIDPHVDSQTRTAKTRVQVSNSDATLRIGMYVDVSFTARSAARVPVIPAAAVQSIGSKQFVYLRSGEDETRFVQRPIKLGEQVGDGFRVLEGLQSGERMVTAGSFQLRAESLRQHPNQ